MLRPSPAINYVAVALFCSRESIPHEKINALPTFNTTYTAHTANTIVNAFPPRNFRGFVAPNPIASKIMFQNEKKSIDVPSDISHFAESSGKKVTAGDGSEEHDRSERRGGGQASRPRRDARRP